MFRNRFRKSDGYFLSALRALLPIALFAAAIIVFKSGVARLDETSRLEGLKNSQAALTRAVTACYAIEGRYPPDVEYMRENYGLSIDEGTYIIHYSFIASNLTPEMWVQERYF